MSQGKRNYLEAKLHLQIVNQKQPKDAQRRELRGQAPYKRAKYSSSTYQSGDETLVATAAEQLDIMQPAIEDSGSDSWDDGEMGMVSKPDYAAAFGFLAEEDDQQRPVIVPAEDSVTSENLMIVDEEGRPTQPSTDSAAGVDLGELKPDQKQIVDEYKREAESLLLKIEKQQDQFQQEQIAQFFQQIDLSVGTKTKAEMNEIKLEARQTKQSTQNQQFSLNFNSDKTAMLPREDLIQTFMTERNNAISINLNHQATKFPVFKNVKGLWRFDYAAAEKKRFLGKEMWDPTRLPEDLVDQYLQALSFNWGPKSGLTEEIALKYLQRHDFSVELALRETLTQPALLKALIRDGQRLSEKIETVAFIGSLLD